MGLYVYKQNIIGINIPTDSAPTKNSDNFITSGNLYSIINSIHYSLESLQKTIKTLQTNINTLQQTIQVQDQQIQSLTDRVSYLESLHTEDEPVDDFSAAVIDNELTILNPDTYIDEDGWLIINSNSTQVDNNNILTISSSGGNNVNANVDNENTFNLNGALNVNSEDLLEINDSRLQVDEDGYVTI